MRASFLSIILLVLIGGCAQNNSQYNWGAYSLSLYDYGRDSTKQGDYVKALAAIVKDAPNKKVPPGIYAEYGFMELNAGHTDNALSLFAKEKQAWPESSAFMDRVSNGIKGGNDAGNAAPSQKTTPVS
jgi:hypothetical protein